MRGVSVLAPAMKFFKDLSDYLDYELIGAIVAEFFGRAPHKGVNPDEVVAIGAAIQAYAEGERTSVVRNFCGHGLGRVFHAPPNVLHYGRPGTGAVLEEGMFFTVEPMINLGRPETKVLIDDWTAVTQDKSLSAQFEHSIGITADGAEIFTLSPGNIFHPTYKA